MPEGPDWSGATWAGNRRRQHREFLALTFREKLAVVEQLGEVASLFGDPGRLSGIRASSGRPEEGARDLGSTAKPSR